MSRKIPKPELIVKKSKGYSPVSDFEAHLNAYETFETTCAERKQRVTATTHSETRLFHQRQNPDGILSESFHPKLPYVVELKYLD